MVSLDFVKLFFTFEISEFTLTVEWKSVIFAGHFGQLWVQVFPHCFLFLWLGLLFKEFNWMRNNHRVFSKSLPLSCYFPLFFPSKKFFFSQFFSSTFSSQLLKSTDFSKIATPLTELTKKGKPFTWNDQCDYSFWELERGWWQLRYSLCYQETGALLYTTMLQKRG